MYPVASINEILNRMVAQEMKRRYLNKVSRKAFKKANKQIVTNVRADYMRNG